MIMNILSIQFGVFVIVASTIYHLLPWKWKKNWLLIISYGFYITVDFRYAIVLLVLTIINYLFAQRTRNTGKNTLYSSSALFVDFLSFGLLKWLTSPYIVITAITPEKWILPIGFSFYLLQLIGFQLEIRQMKIKEMPSFVDFAVYLVYFPKLLSGPIEKPSSFLKKLANPVIVTNEIIDKALGLVFNGLVRKVLIANLLQILVLPIFVLGKFPSWISLISYAIVLYNDFAGYTSIVRGVSLFFGIELSANFQQPYLARSFSEFWSRWHISLSTWLRETIYFPLSRKLARLNTFPGSVINYVIPPVITMLVSGFWHGATLAMLTWGFAHGILLIIERLLFEKWPQIRPSRLKFTGQFTSRFITFIFVCLGWVPFSSPGLQQSIEVIRSLIFKPYLFNESYQIFPIILIVLSFLLDIAAQKSEDELWWQKTPVLMQAVGISVSLLALAAAITYQIQEPISAFIYQGF
jgi:alginate O-acetyltransferase complex protein AlgI